MPTDALPAAEFIVRYMHRTIEVAEGVSFSAVCETAKAVDGDNWFWTDDNAKVLELLSRPEVWARFPRETAEILHFVRAMCRGPFIFRRLSTPRLVAAQGDGASGAYHHSLMNIRCDLRGGITAGMRFHDERNRDNVLLCGNRVEFTYRGRRYQIAVEEAISDCGSVQDCHLVKFWHASDLHVEARRRRPRIGRITYQYAIDARSMVIEVQVNLDIDGGIEVQDVILTIGHDRLGRWYYSTIDADTRRGAAPLFSAGKPRRAAVGVAGASYYVIRQGHVSGDALALHTRPREPGRLARIEVIGEVQGRLHRAIACYSFAGRHRGASLAAAEYKLLTGGGLYERVADYSRLMREAVTKKPRQQAAFDFSTTYDYGVVINAFAKCFAVCAAAAAPPDAAALQAELRSLVDTYLGHYLDIAVAGHASGENTIFSRELSFAILGAATMHRATGAAEYRLRLGRLCEALLDLEKQYTDSAGDPASGFMMRIDAPPLAPLDCHSAALLALVHAAGCIADRRVTAAIDRGLAGYCLETSAVDAGRPHRLDTVATLIIDETGARRTDGAFWNFKAGLTLRLFTALRKATAPALRDVVARHRDRLELFEAILRRQLELSVTEHADAIELRCAAPAGETNSETQPWAMLGLLGHPFD